MVKTTKSKSIHAGLILLGAILTLWFVTFLYSDMHVTYMIDHEYDSIATAFDKYTLKRNSFGLNTTCATMDSRTSVAFDVYFQSWPVKETYLYVDRYPLCEQYAILDFIKYVAKLNNEPSIVVIQTNVDYGHPLIHMNLLAKSGYKFVGKAHLRYAEAVVMLYIPPKYPLHVANYLLNPPHRSKH